jgi:acyl carrier protein
MPDISDIRKRVKKIIVEQSGFSENDDIDDEALLENLGVDSLDSVEVIINVEDEFNI